LSPKPWNGAIEYGAIEENHRRWVTQDDNQAALSAATHLWNRVGLMHAVKGIFMEKWLCFGSMGVAGFLLLLFLLDLVLGFPFGGVSPVVDIFGLLGCGLVLYLAYDAFRDLR
jgi:hypothetical protein